MRIAVLVVRTDLGLSCRSDVVNVTCHFDDFEVAGDSGELAVVGRSSRLPVRPAGWC
jgi:hypothetical protein